MDKLYFRLTYASDSTRSEDYEVGYDADAKNVLNLFENIPIFSQKPVRVSFDGNNYDRSFIPSNVRILKRLIPCGSLATQLEHEIFIIAISSDNSSENPLKIHVFDTEESLFPGDFNRPINVSETADPMLNTIKVYLKLENDDGTVVESKYLTLSLTTWKEAVLKYSKSSAKIRMYRKGDNEPVHVYLTGSPDFSQVVPRNNEMILAENGELIKVRSFVTFAIEGYVQPSLREPEGAVQEIYDALGSSFSHGLSKVGQRTFDRLKKCIIDRTSKAGMYAAPIASICQHSGSGKSKMAFEFTKHGPGLNMVLRSGSEEAFPPSNNLSLKLAELVAVETNVDTRSSNRSNAPATASSKIATILDFLASLLMKYLQELVTNACQEYAPTSSTFDNAIRKACADSGPRVPVNNAEVQTRIENYSLTDIGFEAMFRHYQKCSPELDKLEKLQIQHIAKFIDKLLKNPLDYLNQPVNIEYDVFEGVCNSLAAMIEKFPFIFVLDEAHLLASYKYVSDSRTNGFSEFRRALTYLVKGTRIFFLALGTKSVILDMTPRDLDSSRNIEDKKYMPPIVLSGDFDILSREQGFRAADFVPTYETLKNPLVFKLLASLGSPVWSSLLFERVIETAVAKLKNSTVEKHEDYFVAWMIRTGIMANPKSGSTESLVAKRMADLFNLTTDLSTMSVFYPSQPVFGIAARQICGENLPADEKDKLFRSLLLNEDLIDKDRGNLSEYFGYMNALLAIDQSPNVSRSCTNVEEYEALLEEIKVACPALAPLWELHDYVLQAQLEGQEEEEEEQNPDSNDEPVNSLRFSNLKDDYHVTTVKHFLLRHCGDSVRTQLEIFPESTLSGLVNASHVTKLPGLVSFDGLEKGSYPLPLPNNLVDDNSRHQIDRGLLQYGLTRQCAFAMPEKYYGIDLIIPVCLDKEDSKGRPLYTFIALQVKTGRKTELKDILKMQARLHYINCPHADRHPNNEPKADCPYCEQSDGLDEIFGNQIGLLTSFSRPSTDPSETNTLEVFATNRPRQKTCLKELYGNGRPIMSNSAELDFKRGEPPKSLNDPRLVHNLRMNTGIRLDALLWKDTTAPCDDKDRLAIKELPRRTIAKILEAEKDEKAPLPEEGPAPKKNKIEVPKRVFQITNRKQRLFCISMDGFERFAHLYYASDNAINNARAVLNSRVKRFGDTSTVDASNMLAAMLYESILPDYNETLMALRGVPMNEEQSQQYFEKLLSLAKSQIDSYMDKKNI